MHVNTSVVKALMVLRNVDVVSLANLVHVTTEDLHAWLQELGDDFDDKVPFEVQIEILKILGVQGDTPRSDVVHYWRLHESFWSRSDSTYWPILVMLKAFGGAQMVAISPEAEPFLCWHAKSHFGLKFESFVAILEVSAHPLKTITFGPEVLPDLSWVPETMGVLLPEAEYARLQPGAMKVRGLRQYLTYSAEASQWEKLRDAALEKGIGAEQVAALLLGSEYNLALPKAEPTARPELLAEPAPPVARPAPQAEKDQPLASPGVGGRLSGEDDDMRLFVTPVKAVKAPAEA